MVLNQSTSQSINMRFTNKVALVTGGRSGIGLAIAQRLVGEGATVITAQRGKSEAFETIEVDLSYADACIELIDKIIDKYDGIDILVNNAGMMFEATAEKTSVEAWDKTMAVNLRAPFLLIKHAVPSMRKRGGGAIVNIGSIEGLGSNPEHSAYCASKAGLHGLTRAVAVDHGKDNIRCNAVAPGWIDTELNNEFVDSMPDPESFRENIGKIHPIRRTGKPEEVASLVAWLASSEAAFVTGQIYTVDGGRMAQLSLPQ